MLNFSARMGSGVTAEGREIVEMLAEADLWDVK